MYFYDPKLLSLPDRSFHSTCRCVTRLVGFLKSTLPRLKRRWFAGFLNSLEPRSDVPFGESLKSHLPRSLHPGVTPPLLLNLFVLPSRRIAPRIGVNLKTSRPQPLSVCIGRRFTRSMPHPVCLSVCLSFGRTLSPRRFAYQCRSVPRSFTRYIGRCLSLSLLRPAAGSVIRLCQRFSVCPHPQVDLCIFRCIECIHLLT